MSGPGGSSSETEGAARGGAASATAWAIPVVLAATALALRLPGLASRGDWDFDQGQQLRVLLGLVRDGAIPLLGPPSSIGDLHHGALYYYLLAPAALLTDADPVAVLATIALIGVIGVVATWWLARSIGGDLAGLIAGAAMAISAVEVGTGTTIWNPSIVPAAAAIALAAAWRAASTGRDRWWLAAGAGAALAGQAHLLAGVLLVPLVGLYLAALWRRARGQRTSLLVVGLGALGIVVLSFLPALLEDLPNGLARLGSVTEILGDGDGTGPDLLLRALVVPIRLLSWPLVGLFTDALVLAIAASAIVAGLLVWRARAGDRPERLAMTWLGLTIVWSWLALVVAAPSLGTVVRELPVDHYHAFLDPAVATALGVGLAALLAGGRPGRLLALAIALPLLVWNVVTQPPLVNPDGGWPAGEAAGVRIVETAEGAPIAFVALPEFKGPDAYRFPAERARATVLDDPAALPDGGLLVVLCDAAFEEAIGAACAGPAEAVVTDGLGHPTELLDRFEPSPGRWLSLYRMADAVP